MVAIAAKIALLLAKLATGIPITAADLLELLDLVNREASKPNFENPANWRRVATLQYSKDSDFLPVALAHRFTSPYVRTVATAKGIPERWYRAGWVNKSIDYGRFNDSETDSGLVPINRAKVFYFEPLTQPQEKFSLSFTPVYYLFTLKVEFWEYFGPLPGESSESPTTPFPSLPAGDSL